MPARECVVLDENTNAGKKAAAAKKRNVIAMASFTMSFTSEGTMGLAHKAMSSDWPGGLAHLVWWRDYLRNTNQRIPLLESSFFEGTYVYFYCLVSAEKYLGCACFLVLQLF